MPGGTLSVRSSIGVLLIVIAVFLIIEMKALLIGEAADAGRAPANRRRDRGSYTNVDRLIHMRTQHLGPDEILVGAKVEYSSSLSADELVTSINETERAIRSAVPRATVIYIEPDLHRDDYTRGAGAEPTGDGNEEPAGH